MGDVAVGYGEESVLRCLHGPCPTCSAVKAIDATGQDMLRHPDAHRAYESGSARLIPTQAKACHRDEFARGHCAAEPPVVRGSKAASFVQRHTPAKGSHDRPSIPGIAPYTSSSNFASTIVRLRCYWPSQGGGPRPYQSIHP